MDTSSTGTSPFGTGSVANGASPNGFGWNGISSMDTRFHGTSFELMIAGFGTVLFVGAAFVDFYTMPRTYRDDQYLAGALSMYLTYINLFIFILRLIIVLNGGSRRD